jgi:hypothetical protein
MLIDLTVTRHCLELSGFVICLPIMLPAMPYKFAPDLVEFPDQIVMLHVVMTNSSIFLT